VEFILDPPLGVGPVRLGMTPSEARAALETLGPLEPPHERDLVRFRDVDVFGLPALEVVERLGRYIDLEPDEDDESFTARELYLALWRPFAEEDDPEETQGYFFQSVLVARPGYDDTPAEAAARLAAGGDPGY